MMLLRNKKIPQTFSNKSLSYYVTISLRRVPRVGSLDLSRFLVFCRAVVCIFTFDPCRLVTSSHYLFCIILCQYITLLFSLFVRFVLAAYGGICRTELCGAQLCSILLTVYIVIFSKFVVFPVCTPFCNEYSFVLVQCCQCLSFLIKKIYCIVQLEMGERSHHGC